VGTRKWQSKALVCPLNQPAKEIVLQKKKTMVQRIFMLTILAWMVMGTMAQTTNPNYDATLATKLGADDYGMKRYVLVILKTGTNTTATKAVSDSCFAGHMKNINHMVDLGKLIVAGPLVKNEKAYRGIFILNVTDFEEANQLMLADPAIHEKLLDTELFHWYGSAALPQYLETSDKIWKVMP
jgi:uncharacterized protein